MIMWPRSTMRSGLAQIIRRSRRAWLRGAAGNLRRLVLVVVEPGADHVIGLGDGAEAEIEPLEDRQVARRADVMHDLMATLLDGEPGQVPGRDDGVVGRAGNAETVELVRPLRPGAARWRRARRARRASRNRVSASPAAS